MYTGKRTYKPHYTRENPIYANLCMSHTWHQLFCYNPGHIVLENCQINERRQRCNNTAKATKARLVPTLTDWIDTAVRHQEGDSQLSHTCHQLFCYSPAHLVLENRMINERRQRCNNTAKATKAKLGIVPRTCNKHDPPCQLEQASNSLEWAFHKAVSSVRVPIVNNTNLNGA